MQEQITSLTDEIIDSKGVKWTRSGRIADVMAESLAIDGEFTMRLTTSDPEMSLLASLIIERLRSNPVLLPWVQKLTLMQQSVLISAVRGCDGIPKRHKIKPLLRWYRRCVLLSAMDKAELPDPFSPGGGSFTGPMYELPWEGAVASHMPSFDENERYQYKCDRLQQAADDFLDSRDEIPLHYFTHCMHAFEIIGYKHPDAAVRDYWNEIYVRMVHAFHAWPETEEQMDARLGDDLEAWKAREDRSSNCSE